MRLSAACLLFWCIPWLLECFRERLPVLDEVAVLCILIFVFQWAPGLCMELLYLFIWRRYLYLYIYPYNQYIYLSTRNLSVNYLLEIVQLSFLNLLSAFGLVLGKLAIVFTQLLFRNFTDILVYSRIFTDKLLFESASLSEVWRYRFPGPPVHSFILAYVTYT